MTLSEPTRRLAHRDTGPRAGGLAVARQVVIFLLGLVCTGIVWTYLEPVLKAQKVQSAEEARVAALLEVARRRAATEKEKLEWLRKDDAYLEIQARDRLDLAAPGDTVIRFKQPGE